MRGCARVSTAGGRSEGTSGKEEEEFKEEKETKNMRNVCR